MAFNVWGNQPIKERHNILVLLSVLITALIKTTTCHKNVLLVNTHRRCWLESWKHFYPNIWHYMIKKKYLLLCNKWKSHSQHSPHLLSSTSGPDADGDVPLVLEDNVITQKRGQFTTSSKWETQVLTTNAEGIWREDQANAKVGQADTRIWALIVAWDIEDGPTYHTAKLSPAGIARRLWHSWPRVNTMLRSHIDILSRHFQM